MPEFFLRDGSDFHIRVKHDPAAGCRALKVIAFVMIIELARDDMAAAHQPVILGAVAPQLAMDHIAHPGTGRIDQHSGAYGFRFMFGFDCDLPDPILDDGRHNLCARPPERLSRKEAPKAPTGRVSRNAAAIDPATNDQQILQMIGGCRSFIALRHAPPKRKQVREPSLVQRSWKPQVVFRISILFVLFYFNGKIKAICFCYAPSVFSQGLNFS